MNIQTVNSIARQYRHLLTVQNLGLAIAGIIAVSWVWGAVVTLQRNYAYQRQVDANNQLIALTKLQNKTYEYQQAYYKSDEYLELTARAKLGKAMPGEHLVVLPSSEGVKDKIPPAKASVQTEPESNVMRWIRFFFEAR